ncbi:MAG TPA: hypothetical protein VKW06_17115 [Candidatus Angelobacter sp.]|nr:hypothetical protein [Candidatus Angelobacter sp.]
MVSHCANPDCGARLVYLREGCVVGVRNAHSSKTEFFWLCGECASYLRFASAVDGSIHLVAASPPAMPSALDQL